MPAKNIIYKQLLKLGDFFSLQNVMNFYEFFLESQWWTREKLVSYQNKKISDLIKTSFDEVEIYNNLYKNYKIGPADIKTVEDLKKLPIISKQQLKESYPHGCTRKTRWPVKEYFTSGSSGNPFAVMVDNQSMSQARALMLLRANYGGWSFGDPVLQTGMSLKRGVIKKLKDVFFDVTYVSAFDLTDSNLDRYLRLVERNGIRYLMGYPGSIYALAARAGQVGLSLSLDGVVTWGDNLYESFRREIEKQFHCRVTDSYGCGEGIQVAAQCPEGHGGYHVFMPHVVLEIVDGDGMPVQRGECGQILLTRLEPGAMPLIRYKVGDVGRMAVVENCPCGRGLDVLEKIEGRDSDFIYTPNGNKLIVHFFTGIFEYYPEIKQFCVIQNDIEEIEIQIVQENKVGKNTFEKIENEIRIKGDCSLVVKFVLVEKIESKNGKVRIVNSKLKIH